MIPTSRSRRPRVKMDWRAYYRQFEAVHGMPIKYKGRLLFSDGWGYSASEYEGPEYPPPRDRTELMRLQITYHQQRKSQLAEELYWLDKKRTSLEGLQETRSLQLLWRETISEETLGQDGATTRQQIQRTVPMDLSSFDLQIDLLKDLIQECDIELEKLQGASKEAIDA